MLKYIKWIGLITVTTGLSAQSPEIDLPAYGSGPFLATEHTRWALFRNMAGLSESESWEILLAYNFPFQLAELQCFAIGLIIPWKPVVGISLFQSGQDNLINQQVGLNSSIKLHQLNIGLRIKYWRITIPGKTHNSISASAGLQIQITENVLVGIFIGNLTQSDIGYNETLPILWCTGISFKPSTKITTILEAGHVLGYYWQLKFGVEYTPKEKLVFRTGLNAINRQGYLGLGFKSAFTDIDYAISLHPYLGISHQAGLSFSW